MEDEMKLLAVWIISIIGHIFLWGSLAIGFLDWSYDMEFFRTTVFGLILVITSNYLSHKWDIEDKQ